VLENAPPGAVLLKIAIFSTLNVGLAGTGNQTRATRVKSAKKGIFFVNLCHKLLVFMLLPSFLAIVLIVSHQNDVLRKPF
jgi:hypothetical protein